MVGSRIGAAIVDSIIGTLLFFVILSLFGGLGGLAGGEAGGGIAGFGFLLGLFGMLIYFFLLEGFWDGYTVGKKVFGIKVVKDNGRSCTIGASIVRNLLRIIDTLPAYYVLGFILMATSDKRKRLGDMAAGTVVVTDSPR